MGSSSPATDAATLRARQISISINRPPVEVYDFVVNYENLPKWAAGLSNGITKLGDDWVADSPMGRVKVKFVEANTLGVLDHDVTLPSGEVIRNPMRVVPNGGGSELTFTLYRLEGVTDDQFRTDAAMVEQDLRRLKRLLENGQPTPAP